MNVVSKRIAGLLAGSVVLGAFCLPASAIDIDANVSSDGARDADADVSVSTSSSRSSDVDATASIGTGGGDETDANVSIGSGDGGSDANVTLGSGSSGVNGDVTFGVVEGNSGVLGAGAVSGTFGAAGAGASSPDNAIDPNLSSAIASMSESDLVRFKKSCRGIIGDSASYDGDLVALASY